MFGTNKSRVIDADAALPGRAETMPIPDRHHVNGNSLDHFPAGIATAIVGMGCFWGAERKFWELDGVFSTAVGYAGGTTPNPTYEETCSGRTGHTEVVLVAYDPTQVSYETILATFWENHDPTQGMRQGNDRGTQYRSAIYTLDDAQATVAEQSRVGFQTQLTNAGYGEITTEIRSAADAPFFYAEGYHQQYLSKNPGGYCGIGGTGVTCPIGVAGSAQPNLGKPPRG